MSVTLDKGEDDPLVRHDAQALADAARGANVAALWSHHSWFSGNPTISWAEPNGQLHEVQKSQLAQVAGSAVQQVCVMADMLVNTLALDKL